MSMGKKRDKRRGISRKTEYRGLCSTCKKALICRYPRDPNRPVMFCDEFEGYTPSQVKITGKNISPLAGSRVKSSAELEKDSGKYKGLCKSCKNREICTFSKPEGGVWHCEEYR